MIKKTLKILHNFTIYILLVVALTSCVQTNNKSSIVDYTIDSSIIPEISRKLEPFNLKANSNISWTIFEDEKISTNSDPKGEPALSFTSFIDGNIGVDCLNGTDDGLGFSLIIQKDTLILKLKVLSNQKNIQFKQTNNSDPQMELLVSCLDANVILANQPRFEKGEIIQGKITLQSAPFYEIADSKERRLKFKLTAYFKSEPLPLTNKEYKTLKKT